MFISSTALTLQMGGLSIVSRLWEEMAGGLNNSEEATASFLGHLFL